MLDAAACGSFAKKYSHEAYSLLEDLAESNVQWHTERQTPRRQGNVFGVDTMATLSTQLAEMNKKIEALSMCQSQTPVTAVECELCGGPHQYAECPQGKTPNFLPEDANFISGNFRGNQGGNAYQPGFRNHPNLSWRNQNVLNPQPPQRPYQPPGFQQRPPQQPTQEEKRPSLEDMMWKYMQQSEARFQANETTMKNLETQVGQIADILANRGPGTLPSNTEKNPREHVKAVSLRSGRELEEPRVQQKEPEEEEINDEKRDEENTDKTLAKIPTVVPYKPRLPFPQRQHQQKTDKQFSKFLEILKQLHINLPFVDVISQMPSYAKFFKEILSNKRKLEDCERVALNEECSAILLNKLPQKLKDPGSFTIPCLIGSCRFNALIDLGASINLMPLTVFKKL